MLLKNKEKKLLYFKKSLHKHTASSERQKIKPRTGQGREWTLMLMSSF